MIQHRLQTDVWCSSGAVHPDGTLIQTGGYNTGDMTIRLFTPSNASDPRKKTQFKELNIITNGLYRSAQHRAITNASKARLSVATFHDPSKTTIISPASELITESSPPRYRQVTYGDYVSSWYTKGPEGKRNIDGLLI